MIKRSEIKEAAAAWSLRQDIVEKDYALGWLLIGLSAHPLIQSQWVFKGGTCLKKCYIETYRFSEDLDFTLLAGATRDLTEIARWLTEVCAAVGQDSGIHFPAELVELRTHPNPRGGVTLRGKIGYRGPLEPPGTPKIRLDLTTDEIIIRPPVLRPVYHPYADRPAEPARIRCYTLEEILAEKTRAMSERGMPRDLYDIVRLFRHADFRLAPGTIREILAAKCAHRGLPLPTFDQLAVAPSRAELESEWANMLAHQLPAVPPLESLWMELQTYFGWLDGQVISNLPPIPESEPHDPAWRAPSYISLPAEWESTGPIEAIRFAGANHLCVELDYRPEAGSPGVRRVEPYALRRSRPGHLLLYARNVQRARVSAYRIDRIRRARITPEPFLPRWRVEF